MAIESLFQIAQLARQKGKRKEKKIKAPVSITQIYNEKKDICILTLRVTKETLDEARMVAGDRADIGYDKEAELWQISLIKKDDTNIGRNGYAVSAASNGSAQIRLTYYPSMPLIAPMKTRKANISCIIKKNYPGVIQFVVETESLKKSSDNEIISIIEI